MEVGYNYRMSNLLAAVGIAQLRSLPRKLSRRREVRERYGAAFAAQQGLTLMPEAAYGRSNCWLTCVRVDPIAFGADREDVRLHLDSCGIEARPVWKPLHTQPAFRDCVIRGGEVADSLFADGLCLPSGSSLSQADQQRVIAAIDEAREIEESRQTAFACTAYPL
jgi:dTDP-4-amino-4,6-dideoxygalactose transaminase